MELTQPPEVFPSPAAASSSPEHRGKGWRGQDQIATLRRSRVEAVIQGSERLGTMSYYCIGPGLVHSSYLS